MLFKNSTLTLESFFTKSTLAKYYTHSKHAVAFTAIIDNHVETPRENRYL